MQKRGLKLNPITSLYYIAPCCLAFLSIPWVLVEGPRLWAGGAANTAVGEVFWNESCRLPAALCMLLLLCPNDSTSDWSALLCGSLMR